MNDDPRTRGNDRGMSPRSRAATGGGRGADPHCCSRRNAVGLFLATSSLGAVAPGLARAETWRERANNLLSALSGHRGAPASPGSATLLVGGPPDGSAGQIAGLLAPLLAPALLGPIPAASSADQARIDISSSGGRDGVTAANAFETRASTDGSTALLVPGHATLAALAGDPRCHFDVGTWVPALATLSSVALVGRVAFASLPRDGRPLALGGSTPSGPLLPILVALTMLGVAITPRFDLDREEDAERALRAGAVDATVISGRDVPARVASLAAEGFPAYFAFGPGAGGGSLASRDPALPSVPSADERMLTATGSAPAGPLAGALRASAAASRLDTALVLPQLAPAAVVARWRQACDQAASSLTLQSAARAASIRAETAPDCVVAVRDTVASEESLLALHRLLAGRWGWHPV